ncbi:SGNH/GDSL hydrolase family protein [Flavihumibacter sp. R14]|nr:SGNH/GDSL hydrolase family protein [Flavihumibacter soli]
MTNCLFFGDSITYGEYDGISGGWVDILKRYCHSRYQENRNEVNVFNLGIGGETTAGLLKRLDVESNVRKSPDENLIFISYGANDLAILNGEQLVVPEKFRENLITAVSKAKALTEHIFLISALPVSERIDGITVASGKLRTNETVIAYNQIIAEVASVSRVEYIDVYSIFFKDKENLISKDGVHPNEHGYKLISEFVKPIIEKYL